MTMKRAHAADREPASIGPPIWPIGADDVAHRSGPAYQAIAAALASAIEDGRLRPGDRLPPQRELAWRLEVTVGTVGRAYELVTRRGLVRGEVGRGTFVNPSPPALPASWVRLQPPAPSTLDLASNVPTPTAPMAELAGIVAACAAAPELVAELTTYPPAIGLPRHRSCGARWLATRGVPAGPDQVVVAGGAQSALTSVLSTLAPPGSIVLGESLTYNGVRTLARRLGIRFEPVALDGEGVVPEALAAAASHTGARVLVVCPTIQNPTTGSMSNSRREAIVEVARRHDLTLVEDDVYGVLDPSPPPPLAALAPERTVFIISASKFLAPALRLAFAAVPAALVEPIGETVAHLVLGNPPLSAEIFARALDAGLVDAAIAAQRDEAAARQLMAAAVLAGHPVRSAPTGLHVWLELPESWTSAEFAMALAGEGVLVSPAERFQLGRGAAPRAVRLSISGPPTRDGLATALARIEARLRSKAGAFSSLV